jgi:spoIIIJ-associated protein
LSATVTAEASGATVGEAKWKALRELERLAPALDRSAVRFEVVTEGEQGLLGVGYVPARVVASVDADAVGVEDEGPVDESETAARVRDVLAHVIAALGIRCRIEIVETDDRLTATCDGPEVALLIGRHGSTIDAVSVLVAAAAARGRGDERKEIVVDAAGYRERRRQTLEGIAVRAAEDALRGDEPVRLEPMSSAERRIVHERLKLVEGVTTVSEGAEPNRRVVVERA